MPKNSGNNFSVFVSVLSTQVSITLIFLKSNCLPLPSLFFRDCSYLLFDINRQTAPVSILNQFVQTSQIHDYRTRSVSSDSFYVKFSRTNKMYAFSRESVPKFETLFLILLKYLNVRPFVKK